MNVENVTQASQRGLDNFFAFLPQLVGAIVILLIGWLIAVVLKNLVAKALQTARFDSALLDSSAGDFITRVFDKPSAFVGKVVFWLVWLGGLSLALSALNIDALNNFLNAVYSYVPHVIAAVLIFLVAGAVSVAATGFVKRVMGNTAFARTIATVVPTVVMSIAVFMMLNELQIATEIVTITYTALIGAVALGMALAFGLGGREVAAELLGQAYEKGRRSSGKVKREVEQATENTKSEANRAKRQFRNR